MISAISNFSIQVGVPMQIAMILTYPERVNTSNIELMRALVRNGPYVHPGANYIQYNDSQDRVYLQYCNRIKAAQDLKVIY